MTEKKSAEAFGQGDIPLSPEQKKQFEEIVQGWEDNKIVMNEIADKMTEFFSKLGSEVKLTEEQTGIAKEIIHDWTEKIDNPPPAKTTEEESADAFIKRESDWVGKISQDLGFSEKQKEKFTDFLTKNSMGERGL